MIKSLNLVRLILPFLYLVGMLLTLSLVAKEVEFYHAHTSFALAVSIDFLFLVPLGYLLLVRKTSIPNVTVLPVFFVSMFVAFRSIPKDFHEGLAFAEQFILPMIELGVIAKIVYKFIQIRKTMQTEKYFGVDVYDALSNATSQVIGGLPGRLLGVELSMLYYVFLAWKRPIYTRKDFTGYKESGVITLLIFILGMVVVETFVFHILLVNWSLMAAWIFTGISIYSGLQVIGLIKSIPRRPIQWEGDQLKLRFGFLAQAEVPLAQIESLEAFKSELAENTTVVELSPLGMLAGGDNVKLTVSSDQQLVKLFGIKRTFREIVFFVDDVDGFLRMYEDQKHTDGVNEK